MARPVQTQAATASSDLSLGYLRAFLVLLVIAHHVATAYAPIMPHPLTAFPGPLGVGRMWGAFPVMSAQASPAFLVFLGLNDTFFMSLLFLLSGVYVAGSIARRGPAGFAWTRVLRLGIPFALAAVFLAPLAYAPAYLQINGGGDPVDFIRRWLATPNLTAGPAWFLAVLLAFDLAAAFLSSVWKNWAPTLGRLLPDGLRRPGVVFLVLILLSALAYMPMAARFGSSAWAAFGPFTVQSSRIIHYALYFTVGVVLGARGLQTGLLAKAGVLARRWWIWLLVALSTPVVGAAAVVAAMSKGLAAPLREALGGIGFVYLCAALSFLCLAIALRFVNRRSAVMDSLTANSYGIYLVHYVFVNWINYALLGANAGAGVKFAAAFAGAALMSWATAALLGGVTGLRGQAGLAPARSRADHVSDSPITAS